MIFMGDVLWQPDTDFVVSPIVRAVSGWDESYLYIRAPAVWQACAILLDRGRSCSGTDMLPTIVCIENGGLA
jgi:hypothetical protein